MPVALPDPLPIETPLRTLDDGRHEMTRLGDGRLELRIWHARVPGVTLGMIRWWFQHFDGRGRFRDRELAFYRWWHPLDHVAVTATRDRDGRIAPGSELHIHEVFGRDPRFAVDNTVTVHRWDDHGIGFHQQRLGHRAFELDHVFYDHADGLEYESLMRVGATSGLLRGAINRHVVPRAFGPDMARAWLLHNIQEVGCFADFLPELYAQQ